MRTSLLALLLLTSSAGADELTSADILPFGFPVWDRASARTEVLGLEALVECVALSQEVLEEARSLSRTLLDINFIESTIAVDEHRTVQGSDATATRRPGETADDDIIFPTLDEEKERLSREISEYLNNRASHFTHLAGFVNSCGHKSYLVEDVRSLLSK